MYSPRFKKAGATRAPKLESLRSVFAWDLDIPGIVFSCTVLNQDMVSREEAEEIRPACAE